MNILPGVVSAELSLVLQPANDITYGMMDIPGNSHHAPQLQTQAHQATWVAVPLNQTVLENVHRRKKYCSNCSNFSRSAGKPDPQAADVCKHVLIQQTSASLNTSTMCTHSAELRPAALVPLKDVCRVSLIAVHIRRTCLPAARRQKCRCS